MRRALAPARRQAAARRHGYLEEGIPTGRIAAPAACVLFLFLMPMQSRADISKCVGVPDFTTEALGAAVTKAADEGLDAAGKRALLEFYENARRNHPKFPFAAANPHFTSRAESAALRNVAILQTLRHLTKIRDGVIAPAEALLQGDEPGAWAAFGKFATDEALTYSAVQVLGSFSGPVLVAAVKIYRKSVETLQHETCLLNIDLEYYAMTMGDPEMRSLTGKERVRYYTNNYLVGGGEAPDTVARAEHRERAQCFLKKHLDPKLSRAVIDSGRSEWDPLGTFVDAVSGIGYKDPPVEYRTAVNTMLSHFDQLAKLEKARRDLAKLQRDPDYRAMKSLIYAISPEAGQELAGLICDHLKDQTRRGRQGKRTIRLGAAENEQEQQPPEEKAEAATKYVVWVHEERRTCCAGDFGGKAPYQYHGTAEAAVVKGADELASFKSKKEMEVWTCEREVHRAYNWISNWAEIGGYVVTNLPCTPNAPWK